MFSSSRKPYTAVTVQIERLTGPDYDENDFSGIVDLIEVIRIQDSGPTEAARAIRKKLKYGNAHRQLRALTILDSLIENGGGRFQRTFVDEPLLERLRMLPHDTLVDPDVKAKCNMLFRQWAAAYRNTPGMGSIVALHKDLPHRQRPQASQSRVVRENEREAEDNPFGTEPLMHERKSSLPHTVSTASSSSARPRAQSSGSIFGASSSSSSKKDRSRNKHKPFNIEREKPAMLQAIANSSMASTNLLNALKFVNRETQRVSDNGDVMQRFENCKMLRRQILRYIQLVESDQWIGSLLSANDELVNALMSFEVMDKSIEDDSDSDAEGAIGGAVASPTSQKSPSGLENQMSGMSLLEQPPAKPPRPAKSAMKQSSLAAPPPPKQDLAPSDDEGDPFGDQHAINA